MKNKSIFAVILIALFSLYVGVLRSQDFQFTYQEKTIYYDTTSSNTVSVAYNPNGQYTGDIIIPSQVTYNDITYTVTSINPYAFSHCDELTSITIPNSVTSIGSGAFYHCSGLTSITIPNSVTSIGIGAFYSCFELTSVTISNSVTTISDNAFIYCNSLTSIDIPNSVTSIGSGAFSHCSGLTSITIPNSVTSIGIGAFFDCSSLTSIDIPNSVTSIGSAAFNHCVNLTSVTIPNSITSIAPSTFRNCSTLTSVIIPNSVISIGHNAFHGCINLTSITIPSSVKYIGTSAFQTCDNLTTVDISEIDTLVFDSYTKPTIISSSEHYGEVNNLFVRCEFVSDYQNDDFFSSISNNIQGVSIEYINDTLCDGDTYNFYGTNINEPGVYFHTIANTSGGCDSLITLNLVTAEKFHDTINKVIYTGDTLDFNNTELTTEGTYIANLQTINGCDSIITLNLFTMARDTVTLIQYDTIIDTLILFDTINTTDTLIVDNYIHDTTTIVDTLILFDTINTTDTLIVDNYIHDTTTIVDTLIINNYDTITLFDTLIIDNYDTIILYDTIIKTIYDTITNTIIDTLVQVVHDTIIPCPKILTYIFANISRGETYTDFGFSVSEEGTYIDTITSMDGCDSIIVLNLTISELNNNQTSQIKMFPNPTNDKIYLDLVNIPNATVIITDIKGQLAKQYNMPSNVNEAVLDIKNLSPGVYSVVVSNTQTRLTKKIIKR